MRGQPPPRNAVLCLLYPEKSQGPAKQVGGRQVTEHRHARWHSSTATKKKVWKSKHKYHGSGGKGSRGIMRLHGPAYRQIARQPPNQEEEPAQMILCSRAPRLPRQRQHQPALAAHRPPTALQVSTTLTSPVITESPCKTGGQHTCQPPWHSPCAKR